MIPSSFRYQRAGSVEEALDLASEHGDDAKFLAGGHSLLPLMKLRLAAPEVIIDLGALHDLSYVNDQGSYVAIGALTRHHDVEHSDVLAREVPLLAHAAGQVGDPQIRHRGTIGGSIAHADPASDLPAVLLALDATLVARGPGGSREIPVGEFFQSLFETALGRRLLPVGAKAASASGRSSCWQAIDWVVVRRPDGRGPGRMGGTPLRAGTEAALAGAPPPTRPRTPPRARTPPTPLPRPASTWPASWFPAPLPRQFKVDPERAVAHALRRPARRA